MNEDEFELEVRLLNLEVKHDDLIYSPPPDNVECDCDFDDEHFHVRCMSASCDECLDSHVSEDFFVYTRQEGLAAIANYCQKLGWQVNEIDNYYVCKECLIFNNRM